MKDKKVSTKGAHKGGRSLLKEFAGPSSLPGLGEYSTLLAKAALAEDIGEGDITTRAVVSARDQGKAEIIAKEPMVLAGLFIAEKVFKELDRKTIFATEYKDGDRVRKGTVIATVEGRLDAMLTAERVALNFIQQLSGIATLTSEFVKKLKKTDAKILDTRKTTPCLRLLEKYAVKAGGGENHRFGLFDCVLIKDNHIKAAGSITAAVEMVNELYKDEVPVEVEVSTQAQVKEALACGADIIMLDNMTPAMIKKAVDLIDGSALVEVSGGVTLDTVSDMAKAGVDFISVGALTHSARAVDISMNVVTLCEKKKSRAKGAVTPSSRQRK